MRCPHCGSMLHCSCMATPNRRVYQCTWSQHMDDRFFIVELDGSLQMVKPTKIAEGVWGMEPIAVVT